MSAPKPPTPTGAPFLDEEKKLELVAGMDPQKVMSLRKVSRESRYVYHCDTDGCVASD
jgi:hypothetical protein